MDLIREKLEKNLGSVSAAGIKKSFAGSPQGKKAGPQVEVKKDEFDS